MRKKTVIGDHNILNLFCILNICEFKCNLNFVIFPTHTKYGLKRKRFCASVCMYKRLKPPVNPSIFNYECWNEAL